MAAAPEQMSIKKLVALLFNQHSDQFKMSLLGKSKKDVNVLEVYNPEQMMNPDKIRHAILGSLRFGKPLVIDLHDNPDLIDMCWKKLDEIKEGLSAAILDKSIMEEKVYSGIIQKSDPDEYRNLHEYVQVADFQVIVTSTDKIPDSVKGKVYQIGILL